MATISGPKSSPCASLTKSLEPVATFALNALSGLWNGLSKVAKVTAPLFLVLAALASPQGAVAIEVKPTFPPAVPCRPTIRQEALSLVAQYLQINLSSDPKERHQQMRSLIEDNTQKLLRPVILGEIRELNGLDRSENENGALFQAILGSPLMEASHELFSNAQYILGEFVKSLDEYEKVVV